MLMGDLNMKKNMLTQIIFIFVALTLLSSCGHHRRYGKHFDKMDTDQDKKISQDEWMSKFKGIDTNSDGFITKEEMKNKHHSCSKKTCDHK